MESKWSGTNDNSFFKPELFDRHRVLRNAEFEMNNKKQNENNYYVISVDVGRIGCQTATTVFKVSPQKKGASIKSLVNIFVNEAEHFEKQAIFLKRLFYRFNPKAMVIDGNGLSI